MNRRTIVIAGAVALAGGAALLRPFVVPAGRAAPPLAGATLAWNDPARADGAFAASAGATRDLSPRVRTERSLQARPGVAADAATGPTVYVVGAVRRPGVYRLGGGARLAAAVRDAGGLAAGADPVAIDLAAYARDGEEIVVPKIGVTAPGTSPLGAELASAALLADAASTQSADEPVTSAADAAAAPRRRRPPHHRRRRHRKHVPVDSAAGGGDPATVADGAGLGAAPRDLTGGAPPETAESTAPVDLNTADAATLATLPGIGNLLADRIVRFREVNGPFSRREELLDVDGMTDARYDALAGLIAI